jgi:hypothetical protein
MTKIGRFIVGTGKELGCRPDKWHLYIVTDEMGMVQGHYDSAIWATNLATFLDKADRMKIDGEIDKILRQK